MQQGRAECHDNEQRTHHTTHSVANVLIELDPQDDKLAQAESYAIAYLRRTDAEGAEWLDLFSGRYVDRFEQRGGATVKVERSGGGKGLRVAFPDGQGGVRWVLPSRLDAVETVFAMTVHKSQGSEFDHVALVLPDRPVAVLTRELLYTGITRAKAHLTWWVPKASVLWAAASQRVTRSGGLAEALFHRSK